MQFKFMILFRQPPNLEAFENRYNDLLALIERMPDIERRQVISVMGSPQGKSIWYRILEVYFKDKQTLDQAMLSPQGQEAGGELMKFPKGTFEMVFAEVYEEAGGRTVTTGDNDENAST